MTDPRALSRLDQEFVRLLRSRSAQGKSKTVKSHGIGIAEVKELHREVYRLQGEEQYEPKALLRCLSRLKAHGCVAWPGRDDGERVALPLTVKVYRQPETSEESFPLPPLAERLSWLADRWARLPVNQQAVYTAVNEWMLNDPDPASAPQCERALEIFGKRKFVHLFPEPEKAFRKFSFGPYFSDAANARELLTIRRSQPPLLTERYFGSSEESGYASMGPGKILMVVENYTTCWSMAEALKNVDHDLRHLAWGIGKSFVSSVASIRSNHGVRAIRYFGDIDVSGLAIPAGANARAAKNGLPEVEPAAELYDALFALGTALPGKEKAIEEAQAEKLAAWLPERHRERAIELMVRGERLAQEWVGLRHLLSSGEWHAAVR
ncbi:DUF2220 family protein [Streptomyces sp. SL13]|uniref:DUF2220 family protein n=1 Tax=Streptantibioticus silvisoli TaxID=2705255 RepID=A0AA90GXG8_9ACTN|nr:DUF2220 family protein [Streptantibioticus silvisoli]MDI5969933.1 DUF2220 family protein [Streptantibioticus silvisoli]